LPFIRHLFIDADPHRLRIDGWRYSRDLRFEFGYAGGLLIDEVGSFFAVCVRHVPLKSKQLNQFIFAHFVSPLAD
jgi:hypothetical protein